MNKIILLVITLSFYSLMVQAQLTTTNLPILKVITTQAIVDTQSQATLEIIDNAGSLNNISDPSTFTSMIGIKTRGNAAALSYPKKSYSVETWITYDSSLNVSVLDLPTENDWVLLAAYTDRSLMRGKIALEMHDDMDRYAPRLKYCELLIDNVYQGVYLFGEKIKRDSSRLDLANLRAQDNFGSQLTGGYILTIDDENGGGFTSSIAPPYALGAQQVKYLYEYPDNGDITPAQADYIESYVDSFETALNSTNFQDTLNGWRPFMANNALIDFIIVNEVAKNNDAYRIDMYLYKDRDKKMRPGPMWGFDKSLANTTNCASNIDTGFAYLLGQQCGNDANLPSFWWEKLMQDTQFVKDLQCRYQQFRMAGNPLDIAVITAHIDSIANLLNANGAQARNFTTYPIFGTPLINEPTPMAVDYATEVSNIKTFLSNRLTWLDAQWATSNNCFAVGLSDISLDDYLSIYPNPANEYIQVDLSLSGQYAYTMHSIDGKVVRSAQAKGSSFQINCSQLKSGLYLLQLTDAKGHSAQHKVLIQ